MKKYFCVLILFSLLACSKEEKLYSEMEMKRLIDSSVAAREIILRKRMADDLDQRSTILVPPKADSIVQARNK